MVLFLLELQFLKHETECEICVYKHNNHYHCFIAFFYTFYMTVLISNFHIQYFQYIYFYISYRKMINLLYTEFVISLSPILNFKFMVKKKKNCSAVHMLIYVLLYNSQCSCFSNNLVILNYSQKGNCLQASALEYNWVAIANDCTYSIFLANVNKSWEIIDFCRNVFGIGYSCTFWQFEKAGFRTAKGAVGTVNRSLLR